MENIYETIILEKRKYYYKKNKTPLYLNISWDLFEKLLIEIEDSIKSIHYYKAKIVNNSEYFCGMQIKKIDGQNILYLSHNEKSFDRIENFLLLS